MSFCVYEMSRGCESVPDTDIICVPLDERYIVQYKEQYNLAFYPMRKALNIRPYSWFNDYGPILEKASDIYIFTRGNELVGSVACYGNEIDDLFVSESNLRHGYGRKLLIWALNQIASRGYKKCVVHVAEWNQGAVRMYLNEGFEIAKKEIISI